MRNCRVGDAHVQCRWDNRLVNKHQLEASVRGVRLLTGHLREKGESLDAALANGDFEAASLMIDPLVNVATILVRQLKAFLASDVSTALLSAHGFARTELDEFWYPAGWLIEAIISGEYPPDIEEGPSAVCVGAQEIARGAAAAIAELSGEHPNAVVARLRRQLREQGEAVQLSDKEGVKANMERYASDPVMRQSRIDTAVALAKAMNRAANYLHNRRIDLRELREAEARDCYAGLSQISFTAAALGAGVIQLIGSNNHYPAFALIRQLVETEFVLWKFQHDPTLIPAWLNSERDAREQSWKPSRIYRDGDNDYRQKDYSGHCEMGGHPTPVGTLLAAGNRSPVAEAGALGDLILHLRDSYNHMLSAADALDVRYSQTSPSIGTALRMEVQNALDSWKETDKYGFSTMYFSDPID